MTVWIGTSWKMNKTRAEAVDFARALCSHTPDLTWPGIQAFVIPPATAITSFCAELGTSHGILVGAQNAHWEDAGAWTGELSMGQVADAGAGLVELGHSERREHFGETDRTVNLKVLAALRHGLRPLVCVGESQDARSRGAAVDTVLHQAAAALEGVRDPSPVLLAYEPVWAIGERGREPDDNEVADVSRALAHAYGGSVAAILYGGSVSTANAARLLQVPGVGGLFVGRSAWTPQGFLRLVEIAARALTGFGHTTHADTAAPLTS